MLPKRKIKPSDDQEGEWIMSYADTVTLLLCFFVIFFSQNKLSENEETEKDRTQVLAEVIKEKEALENEKALEAEKAKMLKELKERLVLELQEEDFKGMKIIETENEIIVRLNEKEFFKVGSYRLINSGKGSLAKISKSLAKVSKDFDVYVEGHTDSKPVSASASYRSNLGLSSLRASTAAEVLVENGLDPSRVRATGYGDSVPVAVDRILASETSEVQYLEDQASQNRRVEVTLR